MNIRIIIFLLLATLAGKSAPIFNGSTLSNGLIGYWTFNEGTGTKVFDQSGHGNTGYFVSTNSWTNGFIGSAISFQGGLVAVTNFPGTNANMTVAFWFKGTNNCADSYLLADWVGEFWQQGYMFQWTGNNMAWGFQNGAQYQVNATITKSTNWNFVCGTRATNILSIFTNGVFAATATAPTNPVYGNWPLAIGSTGVSYANSVGNYSFWGCMDDVRIYNRVLSPSEISQLYGGGYGR